MTMPNNVNPKDSIVNEKDDLNLRNFIIRNEGTRLKMYKDSLGYWTIGVGRCIEKVGIRQSECDFMLDNDIRSCYRDCERFAWFKELGVVRQHAVIDMVFCLGLSKFILFKKLIKALSEGNFTQAAHEVLDSKYAKDVKDRANRVAYLILYNEYPK